MKRDNKAKMIAGLLGGLLLVGCLIAGVISFTSFHTAKELVDSVYQSPINSFNEELYSGVIRKLRLLAVVFLVSGGLVFILGRRIGHYVISVAKSFLSEVRFSTKSFSEFIKHENRIHLAGLAVIVISTVFIRLYFLTQPIRNDEALTYLAYSSKPLFIVLARYGEGTNHLFHTLLTFFSVRLLGNYEWSLRLPAFIAGVLCIPMCYAFVRGYYNKHAALLTSSIMAGSAQLIFYSTNARGYSLIMMFTLALLIIAQRLKTTDSPFLWLSFAVCAALGFYTHPTMLYPYGIVMVWLVLSLLVKDLSVNRKLFVRNLVIYTVLTFALIALFYSPVFIYSGVASVTATKFVSPIPISEFVNGTLARIQELLGRWRQDVFLTIQLVFLIGLVVSLIVHKLTSPHRVNIILAAVLFLVPVIILQRVVPQTRQLLFMLPLMTAASMSGLVYLAKLWIDKYRNSAYLVFTAASGVLLLCTTVSVLRSNSVLYSPETGSLYDAHSIEAYLKQRLNSEDSIVAESPSYFPLWYYFRKDGTDDAGFERYSGLDPDKANSSIRLFVVVNFAHDQSLEDVITHRGIRTNLFALPKEVRRFNFAAVYQLDKLGNEKQVTRATSGSSSL